MSYSSNIKSLSNSALDAKLASYGAATFGSTERKRQRLQRFITAEERAIANAYWSECALDYARQQEQERVQTRAQARMAELRSHDTEEEPPLKRQCTSPTPARPLPPGRMVTRSMAQRPPSPARRPSHPMVTRSQDTYNDTRTLLSRLLGLPL